ncbi:hypothetical protein K7E08_01835 [Ligilactobacillus salivarius]|uniref:hypothetical protein n=1 Tax=Ligilactobacillus salivarius TaxID=1624 RepID=UPI001CBD78F0|nr:hypothetical protein [Ligilactobacillus salivarius]MBZ4029713.1 hypothetical protein [Ligilactobacillus salivarius]
MTYLGIRTIAGILVVATLSITYHLKTVHAWIFVFAVTIELVEIPLLYYYKKKKNK